MKKIYINECCISYLCISMYEYVIDLNFFYTYLNNKKKNTILFQCSLMSCIIKIITPKAFKVASRWMS